jgi:hypothetical protein
MKLQFHKWLGVHTRPFDPEHTFVTSWLLPPYWLASLRALISLYSFVTIFTIWGYNGSHSNAIAIGRGFSYFTNLTYWGIAFYFLVSAVHTFTYARNGIAYLDKISMSFQALHALFYTTILTFPFLVTLVFWIVLYNPPWFPVEFKAWSNVRLPWNRLARMRNR